MTNVFIDGSAGTTGLRIYERLESRRDIQLIKLSEKYRKDKSARKEALDRADIAFLCLPDDAARESVSLIENPDTVVIDTSTAHRTTKEFAYGFPQLSAAHKLKIENSKRIAVPGCHASGFISLVYPLVESGILDKNTQLSCFSVTGYSGGGKKMIAEYEQENREILLSSPRQYGIGQTHKHLPEMTAVTGLSHAPIFSPIVADFYSGMTVTVPIFKSMINGSADDIRKIYREKYQGPMVRFQDQADENGFVAANKLSGYDSMEIFVCGNEDRILLISRFDNLGKGASGAAIECMNIVLGLPETTGLNI